MQPGDKESAARARVLFGAIFRQLSSDSTQIQVRIVGLAWSTAGAGSGLSLQLTTVCDAIECEVLK